MEAPYTVISVAAHTHLLGFDLPPLRNTNRIAACPALASSKWIFAALPGSGIAFGERLALRPVDLRLKSRLLAGPR